MSDDDVSKLWDAIDKLREGQSEVLAELRALISMLGERCEARASVLVDHASRIKTLELALQAVKLEQVRQGVLIGLGGGLVGSIVTMGGMLIVKKLGG